MKHLAKFEKWFPWSNKKEPEDLKKIVETEIESNPNIVLLAYRYGKEVKSRVIIIPIGKKRVIVKRIGNRCKIKKDEETLEIEKQDFNSYWTKCIEKKYKIVYK